MADWKRSAVVAVAALAFAGTSMGASSCAESSKQLDKTSKDLNDLSGQNDARYRPKIKQLKFGMTKAEVRSIMGAPPRDKQHMSSQGMTIDEWYYGSYQLSFTDGKLDSKNKY